MPRDVVLTRPVQASPPDDVLGSRVIEIRDTWANDGRVYCEVRTAAGWVATCMALDGDWIVCHAYRVGR